jgi:leader peptidase (prepilin peptidase)/N-methyltransferase
MMGSFVGVAITRTASPYTIVWGRSECDVCHHRLLSRDLIPILSWFVLRGRCRHCATRISGLHPLIELSAIGVAAWAAVCTQGLSLWVTCGLGWSLLALATIDTRQYLLPDYLTLPLLVGGLVICPMLDPAGPAPHWIGAGVGWLFIMIVHIAYRKLRGQEGIGLGDAKLFAASGAWVSWNGLPSVLLIASVAGLIVSLAKGRDVTLQDRIPLGTFLCLGTWLVWLYGPLFLNGPE